MREIFIAAIIILTPAMVRAGPGEASGEFLRIVPDSRAAAMGEAATAVADDASAIYWNPAALAVAEKRNILLSHSAYLESGNMGFGGISFRRGAWGAGFAAQYFNAGAVNQTDLSGSEQGDFSPSDLAVTCAAAKAIRIPASSYFERASIGIGAKYIRSSLLQTAQAAALDIGVLGETSDHRLRAGLMVANLGEKLKFEAESFPLPAIVRGGIVYSFAPTWRFSIEGGVPFHGTAYGAGGIEAIVARMKGGLFSIRGGFNSRLIDGVEGFRTISMGFGFEGPVRLDYALVPMGRLGLVHRVSMGFAF